MKYDNMTKAVFLMLPNRFIAICSIDGEEQTVHVKNTGRCKELLKKGATVYLQESDNPNRKTKYSLISVEKDGILINIDSQVPNAVVFQAIKDNQIKIDGLSELEILKREVTFGNSRFDIYAKDKNGKEAFVEVKGVTLLNGEGEEKVFENLERMVALFPDAPTERGSKHVSELIIAKEKGLVAQIVFLIQLQGSLYFTPNTKTDNKFAEMLKTAQSKGVIIKAYETKITQDEITLLREIEVVL
ncbi:MAG: DNA/RNA nuclease SfsA [Oscillospiraceae bacterium]